MPAKTTIDRRLFIFLNGLPHPAAVDQQVALVSDLGKGAGWMAVAAWLALRDGRRGRRAAVASVVAMALAVGLVQGPLKVALPRHRPFLRRMANVVGSRPTDPSFPSGHTAGSFAAAVALAAFYPWDAPMLLALASGVGASRVYLGHHFPSDVVAGAGLGAALGALTARLVRTCRQRGSS
jgi:membrane-associated phospholipid phosphatase